MGYNYYDIQLAKSAIKMLIVTIDLENVNLTKLLRFQTLVFDFQCLLHWRLFVFVVAMKLASYSTQVAFAFFSIRLFSLRQLPCTFSVDDLMSKNVCSHQRI